MTVSNKPGWRKDENNNIMGRSYGWWETMVTTC